MTRMTGPDCVVMCNLINTYIHAYTHTYIHTYIHTSICRYFQHAHFIPTVGVGKRGVYSVVCGDLPRQHSFGTNLRFTGPVPADSRQ